MEQSLTGRMVDVYQKNQETNRIKEPSEFSLIFSCFKNKKIGRPSSNASAAKNSFVLNNLVNREKMKGF